MFRARYTGETAWRVGGTPSMRSGRQLVKEKRKRLPATGSGGEGEIAPGGRIPGNARHAEEAGEDVCEKTNTLSVHVRVPIYPRGSPGLLRLCFGE
jgi:hypothetical protein